MSAEELVLAEVMGLMSHPEVVSQPKAICYTEQALKAMKKIGDIRAREAAENGIRAFLDYPSTESDLRKYLDTHHPLK